MSIGPYKSTIVPKRGMEPVVTFVTKSANSDNIMSIPVELRTRNAEDCCPYKAHFSHPIQGNLSSSHSHSTVIADLCTHSRCFVCTFFVPSSACSTHRICCDAASPPDYVREHFTRICIVTDELFRGAFSRSIVPRFSNVNSSLRDLL